MFLKISTEKSTLEIYSLNLLKMIILENVVAKKFLNMTFISCEIKKFSALNIVFK